MHDVQCTSNNLAYIEATRRSARGGQNPEAIIIAINPQNSSREMILPAYKPAIPPLRDHIGNPSLIPLLSPVSCLLSSPLRRNLLSSPACHEFMPFLCKTNPISQTPKSTQHHLSQRLTTILPSATHKKTNPIQTQFKPNSNL